jgi:hypothetical protein
MRQPNIIVLRMTDLANIKQFVVYTNQEVNFEKKKPTRKKRKIFLVSRVHDKVEKRDNFPRYNL